MNEIYESFRVIETRLRDLYLRVSQLEAAPTITSSSGGGAPVDAEYLTLSLNTILTQERRFDPSARFNAVDGGAGGDYDFDLATTGVVAGIYGSATQVGTFTVDSYGRLTAASNVAISGVPPLAHNVLSVYHSDTLADNVVDGDIIIGNVTPKWSRLPISIPALNVRNVLGIDNGELRPSWKTALDSTNPTTISIGSAASPGTSLIFAHRDHVHGAPSTWTPSAHNILDSTYHGDSVTQAVSRGSLIYGNATPKWDELTFPGGANYILTTNATDVVWSTNTLSITGNSTINGSLVGNITGGGTISTGGFTGTIPATGTLAIGAGTLTVSTINDVTGATHTHAITSSSNTGAAASILASDVTGGLSLVTLTTSGYLTTNGNLFMAKGTAVNDNMIFIGGAVSGATNQQFGFFVAGKGSSSIIDGPYFLARGNAFTTSANQRGAIFMNAGKPAAGAGGFNGCITLSAPGSIYFATGWASQVDRGIIDGSGNYGIGTTSPATRLHAVYDTATNNAILETVRIESRITSTGVGAAGFGPSLTLYAESATNGNYRQQAQLASVWATATDATRKARSVWSVWDTAEREGIRIEASGSAPMLSFYGGAAVIRGNALTAQLTTITHTAPGTPDYAIQDLTNVNGYGFVTKDEGNTVLSVIANLQTRVAELEARLGSATGVNLFA